jgi:N-acylneuraminate cytidylyltransferase
MSLRLVLAVIPARGGSKSVPKKNIRPLLGRPLIAYTLQTARQAKLLDRIVVSTDDDEIAGVAAGLGAEVIRRPAELATDAAPTELALLHVLEVLGRTGYHPEAVVTLEPTSPLRTAQLIDRCIEALAESEADAVISVKETRACYGTLNDGRFEYLIKDQPRRRQERPPLYQESSTVYATRTAALVQYRSVLGRRLHAVVADELEAIDINSPLDFAVAEAVMRWRMQEGAEP